MNTGSKKKFLVTFTLLTSVSVFLVMCGITLHGLAYISLPNTIIYIFLFYSFLALGTLIWLVLRATSWYDSKLANIYEAHAEEIATLRASKDR